MVVCAAYNCNVTYGQDGTSMFAFPTDKRLRKIWVEKLKTTAAYSPSRHTRLCERHFEDSQFTMDRKYARSVGYRRLQLRKDAIPTIFDYTQKDGKRKVEEKRVRKSKVFIKRRVCEILETPLPVMSQAMDNPMTDLETAGILLDLAENRGDQTESSPVDHSVADHLSHSRCQPPSEDERQCFSSFTQTTYNLVGRRHVKLQADIEVSCHTAPPIQKRNASTQTEITQMPEDLNESIFSMPDDTLSDPDWSRKDNGDPEESITDLHNDSVNPATERKFIVFESALDLLFSRCQSCGMQPETTKRVMGTNLTVDSVCSCGDVFSWDSQPHSGTMPLGNLIVAGAVLFSGSSPVKVLRMLNHAGIQTFCLRTYHNIQSAYLVPAVTSVWQIQQLELFRNIKEAGEYVVVGGDGRCCSPGHTAKYGSYSLMDLKSNKILDMQLVQSNEVKNSYAMELEGLKRSLSFLSRNGIQISHLITDRHSQIKKYMQTEKPEIQHWFDCWHVAKGIYKKLEAEGKKKMTGMLLDWARSISNHLYWCAASSNGDGELVLQKWLSILNHVTDVHSGHGDKYTHCQHEPLTDRLWIKPGSRAFQALEKIVKGRLLVNDVKKLSPAQQTSGLEAFHKVVCHFAPKLVHYFHSQMEARLLIAALHFNENASRPQAKTKDGYEMFSISFPKSRKGEGIAKEVKEQQTFDYVHSLMEEVLLMREVHQSYSQARGHLTLRNQPRPLSHSTPHKPKHVVVEQQRRRFNRNSVDTCTSI